MPQRIENGDGATALGINAILLGLGGYGWLQGCGLTIGGSTEEIQLKVGSGVVLHDSRLVSVDEQTVTLQPGEPTKYRKDLIWIDREGNARVTPGIADDPDPPDKEFENTAVPMPPDASRLDGVPIGDIWVPIEATSSGNLDTRMKTDRRIPAPSAMSGLETRDDDPPDEELLQSRMWVNESLDIVDGPLRVYLSHLDTVYSVDLTAKTSLSGPTERVVENFEDSIDANWRGGDSSFTYDAPAFEGTAAAAWSRNAYTRDYSLPGDGLDYYAEGGDQIRLAIRFDTGNERLGWLGFGKSDDDYYSAYRVRLDPNGTLQLQVADSNNNVDTLGSASASISAGNWYVIEVDYDGGGRGVHPCRVYSTANGSRDTILAEIAAPTANTDYRGRGYTVVTHAEAGEVRLDRLSVTPGGA